MGELLLEKEKPGEAIPYLQEALALDGKNPTFHEQLGRAYERTGNLKAAETEFSGAITLAPNVPALHYQLGRIYSREGATEKAKEEFARCADLNATSSNDLTGTPNPTSIE
jgi:tetratricopeptide (TPR) repeat protein